MKILLHGINFAPELTGTGKYTGEMAAWLVARGHQVRVVCAPPYYPQWAVSPPYSTVAWQIDHWQGVEVWRCPLWVPAQPGGFKRLLHLASFAVCSLPVMLWQALWRPDVVWVVEPALFCAPAAVVAARLCGAKVWLHIQDYEADAAFDLGLLKGPWLKRLVLAVERWLMRLFDVVSSISQHMLERASAKGLPSVALRYLPNWVDLAQYASFSSDGMAAYRRELGIAPGAVVALYSGNMGGKQGLWVLAEVARICALRAEPDRGAAPSNAQTATQAEAIVFVFCGDGAGRADLVQRCLGLPNVRFLDLQPARRLHDLLAMADVHLLPQRADAADLVMPSKLTGMLASARPVVATAHTGTQLATVVQTCGLVVPPEDPQAFATALCTLAADPALRDRLGAAGYLHAQAHMDKEAVLAQFESDLTALVALVPASSMTPQFAKRLLVLLVLLLLWGTQMPGAWRNDVVESLHAPAVSSSVAHFFLFCAIALLARVRPLVWPWGRVVLFALALALLTEGLQFFAIDRHPRWLDVGIDMAGAVLGVALGRLSARATRFTPWPLL